MRACSIAWASPRRRSEPAPQLLGDPSHGRQVELGGEHERNRRAPRSSRRRRRASWLCWKRARSCTARAASAAERTTALAGRTLPRWPSRRACAGLGRRRPRRSSCAIRRSSAAAEALRQHAVDDHRLELAAELPVQPVLQLERLGDRHLGPLRHREIARARGVLEQLPHPLGLPGDRPDARDRRRTCAASGACPSACPVAGPSSTTRS